MNLAEFSRTRTTSKKKTLTSTACPSRPKFRTDPPQPLQRQPQTGHVRTLSDSCETRVSSQHNWKAGSLSGKSDVVETARTTRGADHFDFREWKLSLQHLVVKEPIQKRLITRFPKRCTSCSSLKTHPPQGSQQSCTAQDQADRSASECRDAMAIHPHPSHPQGRWQTSARELAHASGRANPRKRRRTY